MGCSTSSDSVRFPASLSLVELRLPMLLGGLMTVRRYTKLTRTNSNNHSLFHIIPVVSKISIIKSIILFISLGTTAPRRHYQSLHAPRRRGGGGDLRQRNPLVTSRSSRNSIACVTRRLRGAAPFRSYF